MKSTRQLAVIIQAVLAASSFGGGAAWAHAMGTCTRRNASAAIFFMSPPSVFILTGDQVLGVEAELSSLPVGEPALQCQPHRAERDLLPGDGGLLDERHLQRLLAGLEAEVAHSGAVEEVDLVHVGD